MAGFKRPRKAIEMMVANFDPPRKKPLICKLGTGCGPFYTHGELDHHKATTHPNDKKARDQKNKKKLAVAVIRKLRVPGAGILYGRKVFDKKSKTLLASQAEGLSEVPFEEGDVLEQLWSIEKSWRGGLLAGPTEDSQKVGEEKPLENGGSASAKRTISENGEKEESQASTEGCQGSTGVSCCRDEKFEDTSCQERLSGWMNGRFERREVLTGLVVLTIAAAYFIYRR
ncbi:uncharacterized protein LOC113277828 [Papaver somniferum]|nr:uncharacterized protein LOC113277828 [Papaver somniferum]